MNKITFGVVGTVLLFISGVGVAAAAGHPDEVARIVPAALASVTASLGVNHESENTDVQASVATSTDSSVQVAEDTQSASASSSKNDSEGVHAGTVVRGSDGEGERVQANRHGDDQSEGDDNESENESGDDGFSGTTQTQPAVTPPATTGTASGATFTMAQVAAHASVSSCYTAIGGMVYDLTPFIGSHPGGVAAISSLCGIDGTAAFSAQHGGQGNPAAELATLKIGTLI